MRLLKLERDLKMTDKLSCGICECAKNCQCDNQKDSHKHPQRVSFEGWHSNYWRTDTYALDPQVYSNQKAAFHAKDEYMDSLEKENKRIKEMHTAAVSQLGKMFEDKAAEVERLEARIKELETVNSEE